MHLPRTTITDLALVVVLIADSAWDGVKSTLSRLRPYIDPPADLEVRSTARSLYTGLLLIDRNEVLAGIVFRTGQEPPTSFERSSSAPSSLSSRLSQPSSRSAGWRSDTIAARFGDDENGDDGKLPSWADDPRERRDPWRR